MWDRDTEAAMWGRDASYDDVATIIPLNEAEKITLHRVESMRLEGTCPEVRAQMLWEEVEEYKRLTCEKERLIASIRAIADDTEVFETLRHDEGRPVPLGERTMHHGDPMEEYAHLKREEERLISVIRVASDQTDVIYRRSLLRSSGRGP